MGYFLGQVVQIHTVKKFLRIREVGTLIFLQVYSPGKRSKFLKTKRSEKTMHLVFKNRNVRLLSFNECVRNHVCNKITLTIESLITIILPFHYLLTTLRDTLWNDLVFFLFFFSPSISLFLFYWKWSPFEDWHSLEYIRYRGKRRNICLEPTF